MRTLYIVTHPEATHHVEDRVGGWYDSDLTARGLETAAGIGKEMAARIPRTESVELYSSDLRRTAQTAAAIEENLGTSPVFDVRLREKSYGIAEGWLRDRFRTPPRRGHRRRRNYVRICMPRI